LKRFLFDRKEIVGVRRIIVISASSPGRKAWELGLDISLPGEVYRHDYYGVGDESDEGEGV
jgi:hypothetical protein